MTDVLGRPYLFLNHALTIYCVPLPFDTSVMSSLPIYHPLPDLCKGFLSPLKDTNPEVTTVLSTEMLDTLQHSTGLVPKS